ncbi:hypothetical protein [Actinospongicola halichondriae]|uniref:hypothetical protein n=1 Tax=Actinospongicola halichondriae TaxID=3236844 RepID=UPI003D39EE61
MTFLLLTLAIVVALLALLVVGLLRSHAEILRALHDNGIVLDPDREHDHDHATATTVGAAPVINTRAGVPSPRTTDSTRAAGISGSTPAGATAAIPVAGRDHATLLAFLTSGCSTCAGFWEAFSAGVDLPPETRLVIVTRGADGESPAAVAELAAPDLTVVMSSEAWDDYSIPVAPYFVLVDGRSGLVAGEGAAATWDRVTALLGKALADAGYDGENRLTRRDLFTARPRQDRADRELADAGILPGDPRLYHDELPVTPDDGPGGDQ